MRRWLLLAAAAAAVAVATADAGCDARQYPLDGSALEPVSLCCAPFFARQNAALPNPPLEPPGLASSWDECGGTDWGAEARTTGAGSA